MCSGLVAPDKRHARSPPTAVPARQWWNATYTSWAAPCGNSAQEQT